MSLITKFKSESLDERAMRRATAEFMSKAVEKLNDEFMDYSFDLCLQTKLPFIGEPEGYLTEITGTIKHSNYDNGDEQECGRLHAFFVDLEQALNDGVAMLDILDSCDDEFSECTGLFNENRRSDSYLTKPAQNTLLAQNPDYSPMCDNFVYIKLLEIVALHRGKRIGTYFLNLTLEYLARILPIDFFAMKPFPLQSQSARQNEKDEWKTQLALDELERDHQEAMKKLRELYRELGFKLVRGTELMICSAEYFRS